MQFARGARGPQVDELIVRFISLCLPLSFLTSLSFPPLSFPPLPDEFNPEVPKLEKSVSGSSPSRERLLLTAAMLIISADLLS